VRRAALALGSNLGDRGATLTAAVTDLAAVPGLEIVAVSSVFETAAVGGPEQAAYLNAVLVVETDLDARALLAAAQAVEARHGRVRLERWGPRTLDVDVLALGAEVSDDPDVLLPHPRAHERGFVLVPWAEVDPQYVVPGRGRVLDLLEDLPGEALAGVRPFPLTLSVGSAR
jgi:2-amino-4-hydroxy-6-hydroxymethyldihydropteridine diphosphokinase